MTHFLAEYFSYFSPAILILCFWSFTSCWRRFQSILKCTYLLRPTISKSRHTKRVHTPSRPRKHQSTSITQQCWRFLVWANTMQRRETFYVVSHYYVAARSPAMSALMAATICHSPCNGLRRIVQHYLGLWVKKWIPAKPATAGEIHHSKTYNTHTLRTVRPTFRRFSILLRVTLHWQSDWTTETVGVRVTARTTRSSATAKSTARPSYLVGVLYNISPEKICWRLINHFYVIGHDSYLTLRNNTKQWPLRRSRSFKVIDFGTNRMPIYDFLLVINTNLPPILHRFQVMADYTSDFR